MAGDYKYGESEPNNGHKSVKEVKKGLVEHAAMVARYSTVKLRTEVTALSAASMTSTVKI